MTACTAFGCKNRPSKKTPGISFHSFPLDPRRRALWVLAVRRKDWAPSKHSKLCSEHFTEDQIDRTSLSSVRLRENAIPSIFNFPSHIKKMTRFTKRPRKVLAAANHCEAQTEKISTKVVTKSVETPSNYLAANSPCDAQTERTIFIEKVTAVKDPPDSPCKLQPEQLDCINKVIKSWGPSSNHLEAENPEAGSEQFVCIAEVIISEASPSNQIGAISPCGSKTELNSVGEESVPSESSMNSISEQQNLPSGKQLLKQLKKSKQLNLKYRRKIKLLQQSKRRQDKRNERLKAKLKVFMEDDFDVSVSHNDLFNSESSDDNESI